VIVNSETAAIVFWNIFVGPEEERVETWTGVERISKGPVKSMVSSLGWTW